MHFWRGCSWRTAAVSAGVLFVSDARDLRLLKRVLIFWLKLLSSRIKCLSTSVHKSPGFHFYEHQYQSLVQHLLCPNHHSLLVLHGFSDIKSHLPDLI